MAMDKEQLLSWFQAHYLSRQEVLYKLPLSYAIDAFWPELLDRRKTKAILLPLYGASGMPYWYVLTQRISADVLAFHGLAHIVKGLACTGRDIERNHAVRLPFFPKNPRSSRSGGVPNGIILRIPCSGFPG